MTFLKGLEQELNTTQTWNGAKSNISTLDVCLDLFGKINASRNNIQQAINLFYAAYQEDPETAVRILFYSRDIRGGQGERSVFRAILKELAITDYTLVKRLICLVPFYGRWDDLWVLEYTNVLPDVLKVIQSQLAADFISLKSGQSISLLAKWLPSINASSKDTKRLAKKIATYLGINEADYRRRLVALRAKIAIVESKMCANEWQSINYEQVPSKATNMYRKAFAKHDEDGYTKYIQAVKEGKKTIKAATLYPYDITVPLTRGYDFNNNITSLERQTLDAQWNVLPNYLEGKQFNGLVLADVSGSMYSSYGNIKPIDVCLSLAVYIAGNNNGIWKDTFLAYDSEPRLAKLSGNDIFSKLQSVASSTGHMGSTNLMGAIKTILNTGVKNKLTQEEMPQSLIIISDMQFNSACSSNKRTNFEQIEKEYKKAGYTMPNIIFWQVNSTSDVPMTKHDTGTALVSGCSPSILKSILHAKFITPIDLMKDAVYDERYDMVGKLFNE